TNRPSPRIHQRLVEAQGELRGFTLVGVLHQQHAVAVPPGHVLVTRDRIGYGRHARVAVGTRAAGSAVRVAPVHDAPVDTGRIGGCTEIKAFERQAVFDLRHQV